MTISIQEAEDIIAEVKARDTAIGRDMSRWWMYENHIRTAANVARTIASKIDDMDETQAYICALLHDVARTNERQETRFHGVTGYEKLVDKDEMVARSALLHMFLWNKIPPYEKVAQMFFDNKKDYDFVADYIQKTKTTDEDLLIQLADNLSNKDGFVTIEQRAKDLSERRGIKIDNDWLDSRYRLKSYFDKKIGGNIYDLFTKNHTLNLTIGRER